MKVGNSEMGEMVSEWDNIADNDYQFSFDLYVILLVL